MHRNSRILIVDDHPTNVAILEEILADHYTLKTAASGEEALTIAPSFQPALILLDIMMPGIGGYETCRRLRAHPTLRYAKIVMVSAKALSTERLQGYEAGADDYITKPFDEEELAAKVRVHLRLRSLEEVEHLTSNVLALLGHETRTPLNGLLAPLKMLRTGEDLVPEERTLLLDLAYESAMALQSFVEKATTLSAMQAGQWEFESTRENLCTIVQEAISNAAESAGARAVTINHELPEAAIIRMDPTQLLNVITALLENAIRFSPPEGQVGVRVVGAHDHFCLSVTDRGPGIAPDVIPRLFKAFATADLEHHTTGYGLSLAIAQQIVLAHQGTISAESQPGLATTFTVQLPEAGALSSDRLHGLSEG